MDTVARAKNPNFINALQLHGNGKLLEALVFYQRALQDAEHPDILLNVGALLHDLGRYSEALDIYDRALRLAPHSGRIHHNRGNTLLALDFCERAIESYRRAVALLPESPEPLVPMGMAFERLLRHDEAMECYHAALTLDFACAEAHWNRALLLLKLGRFEEGWKEFEWRWKKKGYTTASRRFNAPLWNGERLEGQSILVHAEQAFGDTIQFVRYLPFVAARCGRLVLEAPLPLRDLLRMMPSVSEVIPTGAPLPPYDRHVPLMSLPGIFGTTAETIPNSVPYLFPPRERLEAWQELLASHTALKVGIVWAGRKTPDPFRSCRLTDLAPLAAIQGATFFSLQMDEASKEVKSPPPGMSLEDLTGHIGDFADTAACIASLDVVVTIDTSVAHLSGALGKPTFVLLPFVSDWRWMLGRSDSPWYPTMRLFRQSVRGDWQEPVRELCVAMGKLWTASFRGASRTTTGIPDVAVEVLKNASRMMDERRFDEAQEQLMRLTSEFPGWSLPNVFLGLNYYHRGDIDAAERYFRKAIELDAGCVEGYRCLGLLLNELQRFEEAAAHFLRAVSLVPDDGELIRFLADAYYGAGNAGDACHWYRMTLAREPDDVDALVNLAAASELLNRHTEAQQALCRAIDLSPRDYRPYLNLGGVFLSQNQLANAERCYHKALECRPNDPTVRWNLAQIELKRGNYRDGFREFETRFDKKNPVRVDLRGLPLWDGSPLAGKTLLVVTEQAFGDTIQFCRFLPLLGEQGGRIVLLNNLKPLDSLLSTLPHVEQVIGPGQRLPDCDWSVPMLTIPHVMDITLESLPSSVPYLFPDAERCGWWRKLLGEDQGFRVGMAWKGRMKPDPRRSTPPECLTVLKEIPGISWYSLQVPERNGTAEELPEGFRPRDHTALLRDFSETAALMSQLDLVMTIDSAVAHLAGALGKLTWLLLPYSPDWRWMLERDDSPWYPTMRLFRQPAPGAWNAVFEEVRSALGELRMA